MSAAAPRVPPHLVPVRPASGHGESREGDARAYDMSPSPSNGEEPKRPRQPYPHVQDIAAKAERSVNPNESFLRLLELAERSLSQARSILDWNGRLDLAYSDYLVATIIVSKVLDRHKQKPLLYDNLQLRERYRNITKKLNAEQPRFDQVGDYITSDNQRSGVQPSFAARTANQTVPQQSQYSASNERPSTMYESSRLSESGGGQSERTSLSSSRSTASKPPIHPKPQALHGNSIVTNGNSQSQRREAVNGESLEERFSRLRPRSATPKANSELQNSLYSTPGRVRPGDEPSSLRGHAVSVGNASRGAVSVNTSKDLPKPPSPTYSPVRGMPTFTARHPGSSARDSIATSDSTSSLASSNSVTFQPIANGYTAKPETSINGNQVAQDQGIQIPRRRRSSSKPQETEITAEQLYDYLRKFNVLLIDVRSREEFDQGHIFSRACMCIEPAQLRPGQSAEDLQDTLVLSPDREQSFFDQRDEFDVIVYFDQGTITTDFLSNRGLTAENAPLRYLHDALGDFNQETPLRFPPILLAGGMNAWVDALGPQALQTSNTAAYARAAKSARPIARRPVGSASSKLNLQKKRHREYNPLAPEEEKKWRERARSESIVLDQLPQPPEDENDAESEDAGEPYMKSMDDFYQRFPDVASVERQSMITSPPPNRPLPEIPPIPSYPAPPVPTEPSRPAPVAARPSYSGVSDRVATSNAIPPRAAQLAPYIPPKLRRLPRTGLHNFGVTCYMNATIQCLSATIPLTAFFLEGQYLKYVQRENWKGSKGLMSELYNILLRNLWQPHDADTIRPLNFRKFCARLNREWGIDRQQDAKEFLEFLVDTLHEDLNLNWSRNPLKTLTPAEEAVRERMPAFVAAKSEWQRYLHRDCSRITDLFAGQHISRLQCTTCKHSSTTYEAFYSISVEIPRAASRNGSVDIHDCLRSYCSAEMLSGDELWRCPHCKVEREASKRITITRAPEFLIVHFKRFSAGHSEKARKVHTPIDFPLTGLDLAPYILPPPEPQLADQIARQYGANECHAPRAMTPPYRYDAYAVMRHLGGTMTSGHYISLVQDRDRGCWREFNDDRVMDFQPGKLPFAKRLQNEQAYIVFYQRVFE